MKKWGTILLAIWLVATGLVALLNLSFNYSATILALLAVAAGVLILIEGRRVRLSRRLGLLLLSIYLIAAGLVTLLSIRFSRSDIVLALIAIAAGVLLFMER